MPFASQVENCWLLACKVFVNQSDSRQQSRCQFAGVKQPAAPPVSLGLICGPICLPYSLVFSTKYSWLGGEFCLFFSAFEDKFVLMTYFQSLQRCYNASKIKKEVFFFFS